MPATIDLTISTQRRPCSFLTLPEATLLMMGQIPFSSTVAQAAVELVGASRLPGLLTQGSFCAIDFVRSMIKVGGAFASLTCRRRVLRPQSTCAPSLPNFDASGRCVKSFENFLFELFCLKLSPWCKWWSNTSSSTRCDEYAARAHIRLSKSSSRIWIRLET
jgi:hypothetical protein